MSKIVSIRENGELKQFTTSKIKTLLQNGEYAYWIPEDEIDVVYKNITENGVYHAVDEGHIGYSTVYVNVEGTGSGVLHGDCAPTDDLGSDGYVYLQWDEDEDPVDTPSAVAALGYKYLSYMATESAGAYVNLGPLGLTVSGAREGVKLEFICDVSQGVSGGLFGANVSGDTDLCLTAESGNLISSLEGQTVSVTTSEYDTDSIITDTYENALRSVPNQSTLQMTVSPETAFPTSDMYLMAVNGGSGGANFKVFSLIIRSVILTQAGTVDTYENMMQLHPARRLSDNAYGFFDSMNNVFYPNVGSGSFIAPHEGSHEICAVYYKVSGHWTELFPDARGNYFGSATS